MCIKLVHICVRNTHINSVKLVRGKGLFIGIMFNDDLKNTDVLKAVLTMDCWL